MPRCPLGNAGWVIKSQHFCEKYSKGILKAILAAVPAVCTRTLWEDSSECRFLPIKELDLGKVWEERRGELSVCVCVGVSTSPGRVNSPLLSRWVGSWPRPWEQKKNKNQNFHLKLLNLLGRVTSSLTGAEGGWIKSWRQTRARNDVIRDWVEGKIGTGGSILRKVAISTTSGDQMRAS